MDRARAFFLCIVALLAAGSCRSDSPQSRDGLAKTHEFDPSVSRSDEPGEAVALKDPVAERSPAQESPATEMTQTDEVTSEPESTAPEPRIVRSFPHIEVRIDEQQVLIKGLVCAPQRWLEQIICTPGTREHEALVVTPARPSHVHAALLLAGFEAGEPGKWNYEDDKITVTPPRGDELDILVRYENVEGEMVTESIRSWIRDHYGEDQFPRDPWVFAGSLFRAAPKSWGEGEIYTADYSGSVVGLVTFGDEVIGFGRVLSDDEAIQPPEWVVDEARLPQPGTPVTVILQPYERDHEK